MNSLITGDRPQKQHAQHTEKDQEPHVDRLSTDRQSGYGLMQGLMLEETDKGINDPLDYGCDVE